MVEKCKNKMRKENYDLSVPYKTYDLAIWYFDKVLTDNNDPRHW